MDSLYGKATRTRNYPQTTVYKEKVESRLPKYQREIIRDKMFKNSPLKLIHLTQKNTLTNRREFQNGDTHGISIEN